MIKVKDSHHKKVFINVLCLTPEEIETGATVENQRVDVEADDRVYLVREDEHPDKRKELCQTYDVLIQKALVELCEREQWAKNEVGTILMEQIVVIAVVIINVICQWKYSLIYWS